MQTDQCGTRRHPKLLNDDEQPLTIKTGYELEFTPCIDTAGLKDGDHVKVRAEDGTTYDRCFNKAEFARRKLKVVEVMTAYHWQRSSTGNQGEVPA